MIRTAIRETGNHSLMSNNGFMIDVKNIQQGANNPVDIADGHNDNTSENVQNLSCPIDYKSNESLLGDNSSFMSNGIYLFLTLKSFKFLFKIFLRDLSLH